MFAIPSFFGYNTTFVSTPVATAATGVGETSFTANWNAFPGASYYLLDVSTSSSFSSFVGSYQNFVVISNSQVVSGLTANTTYYYRLRAATGVDADAAAFFGRVYTAGGALSYTEVSATETLVSTMKADGTWTPMKAIYPMVGASAAACAQNLKSSSFTGTFTSGWTFASTGVTPNGTSAYFNTTFNPFVSSNGVNDTSASVYLRTATQGGSLQTDLGVFSAAGALPLFTTNSNSSARNVFCWDYNTNLNTTNTTDSRGMWGMSRSGASSWVAFERNTAINKTTTNAYTTLPNGNVYLGAQNNALSGTAIEFSPRQIAFAHMGDNLTSTQFNNFYTAVQAFQTTLARQVV